MNEDAPNMQTEARSESLGNPVEISPGAGSRPQEIILGTAASAYDRIESTTSALEQTIHALPETKRPDDTPKQELLTSLQRIRENTSDRLRLVALAGTLLAATPTFAAETSTDALMTDGNVITLAEAPTQNTSTMLAGMGKATFDAVVMERIEQVKNDAKELTTGKDIIGGEVSRIDPALRLIQEVPFIDPRISGVASIVEEVKGGIGNQGQPLSVPALHVAGILACAQVGYAPCLVIGFLTDSWAEKINRDLDQATDANAASIINGLYPSHTEKMGDTTLIRENTSWGTTRELPVGIFLQRESFAPSLSESDVKLKTYLELMGDAVDVEPKDAETVAQYFYRVTRIATKDVGDFKPIAKEQSATQQNPSVQTISE